jgi:hypothetical protein|nr:hypothetical protein [Oxalobacteraceae bacterium]
MTWTYQGNPVEQLPEDCAGFVYIITNLQSQRKYIGKKLAKFRKTRQRVVKFKNGNKRKRKIRTQVESDWRDYWGSSPELSRDIQLLGNQNFSREILRFCKSKTELSYFEAKYQIDNDVLLDETKWYNGWVSVRARRFQL